MTQRFSSTKTVVSAHPGWFIVIVSRSEPGEKNIVYYDPIIAWEISVHSDSEDPDCNNFTSVAIGAENFSDDDCYIIKDPGGRMFTPCCYEFKAEEEVIKHVLKRRSQK
jgi:hypothetical protein